MSIVEDLTALKVGPDETLIIRMSGVAASEGMVDDVVAALRDVGLAGRSLVLVGDDDEFKLACVKTLGILT